MTKTVLTAIAYFLIGATFSQNAIPYRKGNAWGFCDEKKTVTIPTIYDKVTAFENNYAKVILGGRELLIDKKGDSLVSGQEVFINHWLEEGIAMIGVDRGKFALIDLKTRTQIGKAHVGLINEIHNGAMPVTDGEDYYLINKKNEMVQEVEGWKKTSGTNWNEAGEEKSFITCQFTVPQKYHLSKRGEGFLYKWKQVLNTYSFTGLNLAFAKYNKLIVAEKAAEANNIYFFLDTNGKYLSYPSLRSILPFNERFAEVNTVAGSKVIYDFKKGKDVLQLPEDFDFASAALYGNIFGYMLEQNGSRKCRFVDLETGAVIFDKIIPDAYNLTAMIGGRAYVEVNFGSLVIKNKDTLNRVALKVESYRLYSPKRDGYEGSINEMASKLRFLFVTANDTADAYNLCSYHLEKKTSVKKDLNIVSVLNMDENGNETIIQAHEWLLPEIISPLLCRAKDTLLMLSSSYLPLKSRGKFVDEGESLPSCQYLLDLDGNLKAEWQKEVLTIFEAGSKRKIIEGVTEFSFDDKLQLFWTNKGYISKQLDILYFD
jgi:hypothetical protein